MITFGVILVDKPPGVTSAGAIRQLARRHNIDKIGHCGTLDPGATGLLVVLIGRATKLQDILMEGEKVYSGEIQLGISTSTDDLEGERLSASEVPESLLTPAKITELKAKFSGMFLQRPPNVSAIKVDGRRSYKEVRQGREVVLAPREVQVQELELTRLDICSLGYIVRCGKGFYVRSLARDIGETLGVGGALKSIRREESKPFNVADAFSLSELLEATSLDDYVLPLERLFPDIRKLELSEERLVALAGGDQRGLTDIDTAGFRDGEIVVGMDFSGRSRGMLRVLDEKLQLWFML